MNIRVQEADLGLNQGHCIRVFSLLPLDHREYKNDYVFIHLDGELNIPVPLMAM